jgi:NOL1/NOP2/fmu family ribosome biogenesis protein
MKVEITKLDIKHEVKTKGIQLDVYDPKGLRRGDLTITKTKLVWCAGKTHKKNGVEVTWDDFIEWMETP